MTENELLKCSPAELTDMGICPTCFNRSHNGAIYGDDSDIVIYKDNDIECFFAKNPSETAYLLDFIKMMLHCHSGFNINKIIFFYLSCM